MDLGSIVNRDDPQKGFGARKYGDPPVWSDFHAKHSKSDDEPEELAPLRMNEEDPAAIGPGGVPSLIGIPPSMNGVIPADAVTTAICTWLYEHLAKVEVIDQVEVEFKIGRICEKGTGRRIKLPCLTETVLSQDYVANSHFMFESSVDDQQFQALTAWLDELSFPKTNTLTEDSVHTIRGQKVRVSRSSGQVVAVITKTRLSDLLIFIPSSKLDIRVSLSLEIPYTGSTESLTSSKQVRVKNRQSWVTRALQVDLTAVQSGRDRTNEVELELNTPLLAHFITNSRAPNAMDMFQELLRYAVDSCRLMTRRASAIP